MDYNQGSDVWKQRKDYALVFRKRANGELPEMESSKAMSDILARQILEGDSILDVGCGAGHYLRSLINKIKTSFSYTGVDKTRDFIKIARDVWKDQKQVIFKIGNIYKLPFKDKTFDIVICNNMLLHLPSIYKPIKELLRVARRYILIRTPIGKESFIIQKVFSKATWPFSRVQIENEFNKSGKPMSFAYCNIYNQKYFKSVVKKINPNTKVEFIKDNFFDGKNINKSSESEGLPDPTRVINGMQVYGYIIIPWHFVSINI